MWPLRWTHAEVNHEAVTLLPQGKEFCRCHIPQDAVAGADARSDKVSLTVRLAGRTEGGIHNEEGSHEAASLLSDRRVRYHSESGIR